MFKYLTGTFKITFLSGDDNIEHDDDVRGIEQVLTTIYIKMRTGAWDEYLQHCTYR